MLNHAVLFSGCDVNKVDANDMTALLWACANGQQPAVEFLIKSGADINISGSHGENALLMASCNGYLGIVEILLKLGMDINATDEAGAFFMLIHLYFYKAKIACLSGSGYWIIFILFYLDG